MKLINKEKEKISNKINELGVYKGVNGCVYTKRRTFCTSELTFDELIEICGYFLKIDKL